MRQLYTNKMFSKKHNYIRIKMVFETRELYANKMFQNETIICE